MNKPVRRALVLATLPFALAACHNSEQQPGVTTPAEDQQLNDAATMLDANSVDSNDIEINASDGDGTEND